MYLGELYLYWKGYVYEIVCMYVYIMYAHNQGGVC